MLGLAATRQIVLLERAQLAAYLHKQTQVISFNQCMAVAKVGYVIVKFSGIPLGLGVLRCQEDGREAVLESYFPGDLLSS